MDIEKFLSAFPPITDEEVHTVEAEFTDRTSGKELGVVKDVSFRRLYALFVLADRAAETTAEAFENRGKRRPSNKALLKYRLLEESREMLAYAIRIVFLRQFGLEITDDEWMAEGFGWIIRKDWSIWWDLTGYTAPDAEQKILNSPTSEVPPSTLTH